MLLLCHSLVRLDILWNFYLSLPATAALRYVAKQLKTVLLISNKLVPSCIEAQIEENDVGGGVNMTRPKKSLQVTR